MGAIHVARNAWIPKDARLLCLENSRSFPNDSPIGAGAILLAAVSNSKTELIGPTFVAFAAQGLEIVKRLGGWDAALKLAHETYHRQQAE